MRIWNDLCIRPVYVALVHRTLGALVTRQAEQLNSRVGTPLHAMVNAELLGKDVLIVSPGTKKTAPDLRRIKAVDGIASLQFEATDHAGIYQVRQGDDATPLLRFAAQSDPVESHLESLSPDDWKVFDGVADVFHWTPQSKFHAHLQQERTGNEFFLHIAFIALLAAAVETVLANRWSHSR